MARQKEIVVSRDVLEELKIMVDTILLTMEPVEKRLTAELSGLQRAKEIAERVSDNVKAMLRDD